MRYSVPQFQERMAARHAVSHLEAIEAIRKADLSAAKDNWYKAGREYKSVRHRATLARAALKKLTDRDALQQGKPTIQQMRAKFRSLLLRRRRAELDAAQPGSAPKDEREDQT